MQGFWDERYASEGMLWGAEPNAVVAEIAADLPAGTVLDLACGRGRNAVWLAQQGHEVTGLDLSPVAIEQARQLAEDVGVDVDLTTGDVTEWDPGGRIWDLVLLSYLQIPTVDREVAHAKAVAAVAPGGTLLLIAHHLDNLDGGIGGPQTPDVLYTEDQLAADFADLEILRNETVTRRVDRDDLQGTAIDVLVLATRPE
jgi:SAM-dependent methyltransferase